VSAKGPGRPYFFWKRTYVTAPSQRLATAGNLRPLPLGYELGEYEIRKILGHGGFGITYLAKDLRLGAEVAIKEYFPQSFAVRAANQTIRPRPSGRPTETDTYQWGLQEFLKEAQALAKFKHNHIVRVLRFLEANGTAYMVMEYEKGESLNTYLRRHRGFVAEPQLLKIFLPILSGLQAVHDTGLLHLDIKPDNIYLREGGQPMLIDFGSARHTKTSQGAQEKVALTRGYSAIEHYPGKGKQGPWTDVYSIGATLYRCVTGREPIDVMERQSAVKARGIDPLTPASDFERPLYSAHIRACIDAAIKIEPEDRPQSAAALQNGLMGKGLAEVVVSPQSAYGSGFIGVIRTAAANTRRRVSNRNRYEKLAALLLFLVTIAVIAPKIMMDTGQLTQDELFANIDSARDKAEQVLARARQYVDVNILGKAPPPKPAPPPQAQAPAKPVIPAFHTERELVQTFGDREVAMVMVAFVLDNSQLAAVGEDGRIVFWDVATGKRLRTIRPGAGAIRAFAVSHDGTLLAYPGKDNNIVLWNASTSTETARLPGHSATINALAFSPDGKQLVSAADDKTVSLWDIGEKRRLRDIAENIPPARVLRYAPNGRLLVAGDNEGGLRFWDGTSLNQLAYSMSETGRITALAFSPDNHWLVSGGNNGHLKIWKLGVDRHDRVLTGGPEVVHALAVSPDSKWILVAGTDESVRLWDVEKGEPVAQWRSMGNDIYALAATADGTLIAAAGDDREIRLWR